MLQYSDIDLLSCRETNILGQAKSAVNKVGWHNLLGGQFVDHLARCEYETLGLNNDLIQREEKIDLSATYINKRFYFKDSYHMKFKNNTNSACECDLYVMRCVENKVVLSPTDEITELRKAAFGDTSVVAKEDDFNQYYSIRNGS